MDKPLLHHFAFNIKPNTLELTVEILKLLNCTVSYRESGKRWCMISQDFIPVNIQLIEMDAAVVPLRRKISTHIAFLSKSPKEHIKKIEEWAKDNNLKFQHGNCTDKEFWFDLPDIFINFVIEIMHTSVVE